MVSLCRASPSVLVLLFHVLRISSLGFAKPQELARPSLVFPEPRSNSVQSSWYIGGGAQVLKAGVSLNPGVMERVGVAWSRDPIPSNDFEVTLVLAAHVPDSNSYFEYDGFALWYAHEPSDRVMEVVTRNEKARGRRSSKGGDFGLFGYREEYDGLGAFLFFDAGSPMLTTLTNTGPPSKVSREDVLAAMDGIGLYEAFHGEDQEEEATPKSTANQGGGRRGKPVEMREIQLKMRVRPHKATIEVVGHGSTWADAEAPFTFRPGGYLGLTALSASYQYDASNKPSVVEVRDVKVVNYAAQEEAAEPPAQAVMEPPTEEAQQDEVPEDEEEAAEAALSLVAGGAATVSADGRSRAEVGRLRRLVELNAAELRRLEEEVAQLKKEEL